MPSTPSGCLVADLGKSAIRVRCQPEGGPSWSAEGPGFNFSAHGSAVDGGLACLRAVLADRPSRPGRALLAMTGAPTEPVAQQRLLTGLASLTRTPSVAACPDYVAAHAGALRGSGVLVIGGTGAIAYAVRPDGRSARVDGWGPHLGDDGGAYAIGRAALRAAYRDHDGTGPATVLTEAARDHLGGLDFDAAVRLHENPDAVARIAAFVPAVAAIVKEGDAVAGEIWADAVAALVRTTRRAAELTQTVEASYAGRLFDAGELILDPLRRGLADAGLQLREPAGTPLDGAAILCGQNAGAYLNDMFATPEWAAAAGNEARA